MFKEACICQIYAYPAMNKEVVRAGLLDTTEESYGCLHNTLEAGLEVAFTVIFTIHYQTIANLEIPVTHAT